MSRYTFHSTAPVRAETLLLGAWIETPFGRQFHTEPREVLWLREEHADIALFWDGELLDEKSNWCCARAAAAVARDEVATNLKLTTADRLEVRVTARVSEKPVERVPASSHELSPKYAGYERMYAGPPEELARVAAFKEAQWRTWERGDWDPRDYLLERRDLVTGVVWSSLRAETENERALAELLAKGEVTA